MREVVDCRSAHIHAHVLRIERNEIFLGARERVVKAESHRNLYCPFWSINPPSPCGGGRNRVSDFGWGLKSGTNTPREICPRKFRPPLKGEVGPSRGFPIKSRQRFGATDER